MPARSRLFVSTLLCLGPLLPITLRLSYLQIVRHDALSSRVDRSTASRSLEIVPRGRILDRHGRVLAESVPAWSSFLDLKVLGPSAGERERQIRAIARTLELDPEALRRKADSNRRTVWIKRWMAFDEVRRLKALKLRSVGIVADERRYYPNGRLARPVLGAVNAQGRGSAGLEYAFDKELSGRAKPVWLTRDGAGRAIAEKGFDELPSPPDLRLSIDRTVQYFSETALARAIRRHRAKGGAVIVQDPASGEVLAMAVQPEDPLRNPAIQDVFEPGSTFKLVVAGAALDTGASRPGERIDCENGAWPLAPNLTIRDHDKRGLLTLPEIIQLSSNIGTAKLGLRLGPETFLRYCRLFGFGYKTGVALPGESAGLLERARGMRDIRLANAAFGQGVAVTALQLIGAFSSVGNGGYLMEPRLVLAVGDDARRGPVRVRRVARPETVERVSRMLERVVEQGTGLRARIPGYRTAGKTGTAQKIDSKTGRYSQTEYISSFVGYFPAGNPRFTILVVVDRPQEGHYGSEVAAPVFAEVAGQLLAMHAVAPDSPLPLRWSQGRGPARKTALKTAVLGDVSEGGTAQAGPPNVPAPAHPPRALPSPMPIPRPLPRPSLLNRDLFPDRAPPGVGRSEPGRADDPGDAPEGEAA
ncbi:MAG: penicillin-binding transpeptidase domain-containing protein [Elusimicrobiota bacterium]